MTETATAASSTPLRLLPSPLHLLPSFLTYPHLSLREKLRAAAAMLSIMRTDRAKRRDALEAESFRDWLCVTGSLIGPSPRCGTC